MTELEQICENALYDVIRVLEDGKSIVRDVPTGRLYFKKTLDVYNIQVFAYLRDHRSRYVPSIQAYWKEGDQLVVIEELVQGRTLEELLGGAPGPITGPGCDQNGAITGPGCDQSGLPDFAERISILTQICDGLEFLHSAEPPIIHRDIKASNIMVTDDGIVKIIDYDAAKIFIAGQKKDTVMIGTQGLAAPEQYGFAQSDVRTDLYALGKLVERMLPDNVDAKRIADKATQMDPEKRYASAAQMKQQILRIMEKPSLIERNFEKIPGFDPMNREHRIRAGIAMAAGIAVLLLLLGFAGWRCLVYPARVTEEIGKELEVIAGGGAPGSVAAGEPVKTSGTPGTGEPAVAPEAVKGEIPEAVSKFAAAHPYQKMNAAQKKTVQDGMESAVARCFAAGNTEDAEKVREILIENYGDQALWEAVYNYGKADNALAGGQFEEGLAELRKCVDEGAPDAGEHWEAAVALTRAAAQSNLELFKASGDTTCISVIINAANALDRYDDGTPAAAAGERSEMYREILEAASAKKAAGEFDAAVEIYAALQEAGIEAGEAQTDLFELISETRYEQAQAAMDGKSYGDAALLFGNLEDYRDSRDKYRECLYQQGIAEQENGNDEVAAEVFEEIPGYKDADERCLLSKYRYCKETADEPTETTYAFFEALIDSGYDGAEELREQICKWHVTFETGMSYSFGPMQSAYVKVTLSGGPPDASTAITFRIDDPTRGEFDVWSDEEQYRSGDTVEISYSEEDSTYNLFDREYIISVYADEDELIGVWEGKFGQEE